MLSVAVQDDAKLKVITEELSDLREAVEDSLRSASNPSEFSAGSGSEGAGAVFPDNPCFLYVSYQKSHPEEDMFYICEAFSVGGASEGASAAFLGAIPAILIGEFSIFSSCGYLAEQA